MTPLEGTAARLRALVPDFPDTWALADPGPGWPRITEVPVEQWCADGVGPASVRAMAVGGALAHAVLARATAALVLDGRAWDVADLVVHRAPAGHLDRVALRHGGAWTVASAAPDGGRVFPHPAALVDALAARAVDVLGPLLDRVRAETRFGLVPLWNAAGDAVRVTAAQVCAHAGTPARPDLAAAVLDALVAHGAPTRGRGTDQPLPGRAERIPVRAACCLMYRTLGALCTTCPLLPPADREVRYAAFLDGLRP